MNRSSRARRQILFSTNCLLHQVDNTTRIGNWYNMNVFQINKRNITFKQFMSFSHFLSIIEFRLVRHYLSIGALAIDLITPITLASSVISDADGTCIQKLYNSADFEVSFKIERRFFESRVELKLIIVKIELNFNGESCDLLF